MYKTKFYANSGGMTIIAKSPNARAAYEAHKYALSPDFSEEASLVLKKASEVYEATAVSKRSDLHLLTSEESNNLAIERERRYEAAYIKARSLTPFYPEYPEQIITTNAKGLIVAYGNNMEKIRKAAKVPNWM